MKPEHNLDTQKVKRVVDSLQRDLLFFLDEIVSINSHSYNTEGVAQVAKLVGRALPSPLNLESVATSGEGVLWICRHGPPEEPPILLMGHLDTVFPPGTFDRGMTSQDPYLLGPGVADMKGGVAVIVGALWALDRLGILPEISLLIALNGDEEIGSPDSAPMLMELARSSSLALVFECGGPEGSVVTSRRGLHRYRLKISGESGHAGEQQSVKQSAVVELAHQVLKLEALNDREAGISVNVGRIQGGTAANVIPGQAQAELEVRFWEQAEGDKIEERIKSLTASPCQAGLQIQLSKSHVRPAMPRTPSTTSLYRAVKRNGARIKMSIPEEDRGGASDANLLAQAGLPTLDGIGPVGEMDHSKKERILQDSLFHRTQLLVHLLWDLRLYGLGPL